VSTVPRVAAGVRSAVAGTAGRWGGRRAGRRLLPAGAALLVIGIGIALAVTDPFTGGKAPGSGIDNGSATSLATVTRQSLSSETQVSGTLGYAASSSVIVPAGTAPASILQAQQAVATADAALRAARATLADDEQTLSEARAKLAADRLKQANDCRGDGAASSSGSSEAAASPCTTAAQAVATDEQAVATAKQKVTADAGQVDSAQVTAASARRSLAAARSSAVVYDTGATYTMLPQPGDVIRRGEQLYAISGQPVLLLYGATTAWRAFRSGMAPGRDVAELNANLGLAGDSFTAATAAAIRSLQASHGMAQTGELPLGSVVFKPGAVRVTSVTPTLGQAVQAGPVLSVTSTRRQVTIALDAAQQAEIKVGDPVTITLPSNETTPGRVSFVGSVATTPSSSGSDQNSTPTIEVDVTPTHPEATGRLDQAPVQISIVTSNVRSALVVPVDALLALAGGGYAVETVDAAGTHRLVGVTTGLFDDADGLVQVEGRGLRAGQRVVVPGS
jgi:multidrug resistance efflux pump